MKFFIGLLLGLAVGVAAGLLLAPQSGEVTRAQLAEQGIQLNTGFVGDIRSRANDALNQGMEMYNRTKDELTDRYSRAKSGQL